jgi:hypothetical protein
MKALSSSVSSWALAVIAVWIAVLSMTANRVRYQFITIGDGPCGQPCVFVPPPIDWVPVLATATVVASIVTALVAGSALLAVVLVRRGVSRGREAPLRP